MTSDDDLRDLIASAIRGDDQWDSLSEDQKAPWRADAERVVKVLRSAARTASDVAGDHSEREEMLALADWIEGNNCLVTPGTNNFKLAIKALRSAARTASDVVGFEACREALIHVRSIISEAAMTGFNWKDGDWADRLFASQQKTSAAIAALPAPAGESVTDISAIDALAQEIRRLDGSNSLGAAALAEALMPFLSTFTITRKSEAQS